MTDSWETAQGLNPNDPNDAGRDFDYDRISNLDEFQNGTNANTDWSFVEIPEGVPLNAITSLNGLGNLAKVVAETDANGSPMGFQIWRWQRDTGWAASHSIGDHDSFILTEVKQNVFGTVAAAFKKYDSVAGRWRGEVRFVSADGGALVKIGHDQDWGIVDHLEITDSGFVIARFQDFGAGATPASKIFRWRNGFVEILKGSTANLYPKGVNERGEIIEASEGVFREGKWTSLGSSPLGINDRAEVWVTGADPNATGIGMWNLSAGYATGYYFNNLADSVAALSPEFESQLAAHASLFDKPGSSDPDDDPLDPVSFVDQENHEYFLTDPVSDAPLAYRRLLIISDINDLGDLAGWYLSHQSDSSLWFDGDVGGGISVPEPEGFLWRGGAYSLLGGIDQASRFRAVSNAGEILVSSLRVEPVDFQENIGDVDGDGVDDFQTVQRDALLTRWGMLIPQNDTDGDGLPDDWESKYPTATQPDIDTDGDGLNNLQEYALGTNPESEDSDHDELPDAWEVLNGLDPNLIGDGELDFDGDGLANTSEYESKADPLNRDTDHDQRSDLEELVDGSDPNTPDPISDESTIDWTVPEGGWTFEIRGGEAGWGAEEFDTITGEIVPERWGLLVYPNSSSGGFGTLGMAQSAFSTLPVSAPWVQIDPAILDWWSIASDYSDIEMPNPNAIRITSIGNEFYASAGKVEARIKWAHPPAPGKGVPDLNRQFLFVYEQWDGINWEVTGTQITNLSIRDSIYSTTLLELSLGIDEVNNARNSLLLLDFEDEEINSGYDNVTDPSWFMVPVDGENRITAVTGASPDLPIKFSLVPEILEQVLEPNAVTSSREVLTFTGSAVGESHKLMAGVESDGPDPIQFSEKEALNIAFRDYNKIKVALHPIGSIYTATGITMNPNTELVAEEIQEELNRIFFFQTNTEVEVYISNGAEVSWDVEGEHPVTTQLVQNALENPQPTPSNAPAVNLGGNGIFDIFRARPLSLEEIAIHEKVEQENDLPDDIDFNIYHFAQILSQTHLKYPAPDGRILNLKTSLNTLGNAGSRSGIIYTFDYGPPRAMKSYARTVAHEIGHQLMNVKHSQNYWRKNAGDNDKPDPERGLMTSGLFYYPWKYPELLIKYEWDRFDLYFEQQLP